MTPSTLVNKLPLWAKAFAAAGIIGTAALTMGSTIATYAGLPADVAENTDSIKSNSRKIEEGQAQDSLVIRSLGAIQCHLEEDHKDSPNFARCIG